MRKRFFCFFCALVLLTLLCSAQSIDVQHYEFSIVLSDKSDVIEGRSQINFKATQAVKQTRFDLQGVRGSKGMTVSSVWLGGSETGFRHSGDSLFVRFDKALAPGKLYDVSIIYKGIPDDGLIISKNKFGDRTFFADNWPNRAHQWLACVDRPDDKASFRFMVSAPSHYKVISNGSLKDLRSSGDQSMWTYEETQVSPTKVMVIGAADFAITNYPVLAGSVPVSAWVYRQDSTNGFYDFALVPGMVKFFSDYIAPFPFQSLANVQSKTIFGGMENSGAIFYAERLVTGTRKGEETMAHEVAHQWFGDMASEKSFAHLWLSEGFATYLTNYYYEKIHGIEAMRGRLAEEREQVRSFVRRSNRPVVDSTKDLMSLLNENSYQKGGWVLYMLRKEIGDSAFHKVVKTYYDRFKGANADTRDFAAIISQITGKNYDWFIDQWLYRGGIPVINASLSNGEILIKQETPSPYRLKVPLELVYEDGTKEMVYLESKDKTTQFMSKGKKIKTFRLDPNIELLYR